MLYLDNCATSKPLESVVQAMVRAMEEDFGNPSSIHSFGFSLEQEIKKIRAFILDYLGGQGQVYFTSGATEANNTVIHSFALDHPQGRIITSPLEHASLMEPIKDLENKGFTVNRVKISPNGQIDYEDLERLVEEGADLVALTHVNSELGSILDLDRVRQALKGKQVHLHIDGVQALGKIPIDLKGVHSYVFSGHKFHGPKGIGGLYLAPGLSLHPLILGGGQEDHFRSGTENVPGIYGLYAAFQDLEDHFDENYAKVKKLKVHLLEGLKSTFPHILFHGDLETTSPYILSLSIPGTRAEVLVHMLEEEEIYISTASACSSHKKEGKNPIHQAIGLSKEESMATLRICLDQSLEAGDLDYFVSRLKEKVDDLRMIIGGR